MTTDILIKEILEATSEREVDKMIDYYVTTLHEDLSQMNVAEAKRECISGFNRMSRKDYISNQQIQVRPGDICYIDFGQAYINETGFQHFGLVLTLFNYKAFVVPMSSNVKQIKKAYNYPGVIDYRTHLYYIGKIEGMSRRSVLFLNDGKFINTSRVIEVKARLSVDSKMFKEVLKIMNNVFQQV